MPIYFPHPMLVVVANSKDVGQNDMAPYSRSIPSSKHRTFPQSEEKKHNTFPTRRWEHTRDTRAPSVGRNKGSPSFYRPLRSPRGLNLSLLHTQTHRCNKTIFINKKQQLCSEIPPQRRRRKKISCHIDADKPWKIYSWFCKNPSKKKQKTHYNQVKSWVGMCWYSSQYMHSLYK